MKSGGHLDTLRWHTGGIRYHKSVLIGYLLVAVDLSGHVNGKESKNFSCELEILLLSLCSVICAF